MPLPDLVKSLSRVRLLATPWTAAHQAPPSMGLSRQEYWSGVPLPSPYFVSEHVVVQSTEVARGERVGPESGFGEQTLSSSPLALHGHQRCSVLSSLLLRFTVTGNASSRRLLSYG